MRRLALCAVLATLFATAAPATAGASDNGPPAPDTAYAVFVEHGLDATASNNVDFDVQYVLSAILDLSAPAITAAATNLWEQTASSATRGAPEVAVPTDTFEVGGGSMSGRSAMMHFMIGDHVWSNHPALWHSPGDSPAGAQRAQVT